ncbi:MAG TPA: hypothetical protein VGD87_18815 [Archangium sp.]
MTTIRLEKVAHGHSLGSRLVLGMMRVVSGKVPDVVRTLLYRREYWGDAYNEVLQTVMRGPSDWPVGERELFASFVANLNRCRF